MDFKDFITHLRLKHTIKPLWEEELGKRVRIEHLRKGQHLLQPGDVCKHIYYLTNGFLRVYKTNAQQEETVDFAAPGRFAMVMKSFFNQNVGNQGIICETDSTVFKLSYHDWLALEDFSADFVTLSKDIFIEYLLKIEYEKNVYRTSNATEKYLYLTNQYPGIAHTVSQKHIASYLGITGPTLSNILKDLLRKA